ncbi:copper amine oxidase N-terminal domain-containing protein [Paenibacillus sp. Marseille-Q4541]|uniref:copper amine oxidase N-terminal domain-containing protein n=1 Tax=Paenibacillus sp. Marseille-Q4541 TaxID=2831522 RepID=UPI001BA4B4DA|nr:copper amine oxidase N-terminal domain-containing protein [Paenibacillus sp. Marseille-Q4541]
MIRIRKQLKWFAAPLALLLVILTGCQAVGGLDINAALLGSKDRLNQSSESKQSLQVKVTPSANATEEDQAMIDLINSFSLYIDSAKAEDMNNASIKGSVHYQSATIPFLLSLDEEGVALHVEGAKQPIYISTAQDPAMPDMTEYNKLVEDTVWNLASFVVKHLPNPDKISVGQSEETVNGEKLNLTKLHAEISGAEVLKMVRPFLSSIAQDENDLKQLIGEFYEVAEVLISSMEEMEGMEGVADGMLPATKEEAVSTYYGIIKGFLDEYVKTIDAEIEKMLKETPELKTVFSDKSNLVVDYYFDKDLNARKTRADLTVALPTSEDIPVSQVNVVSESEAWNYNGKVAADKVDLSKGYLDPLYGDVTTGDWLRNFEGAKPVYDLLLQSGMTSSYLYLESKDPVYGAVNVKGTAFVPLRYFAEQFDAEVKWAKGSKQITVINDLTLEKSTYTLGSKKATVNGKEVTLPQAPYTDQGTVYVPLRSIADALGASITVEDGWYVAQRD